ncbi:endoglucanase 12-like [Wolffia australiana]
MQTRNPWGGSFDIAPEDGKVQAAPGKQLELNEMQQSWVLRPQKKEKYVDLGCVVCKQKAARLALCIVVIAFFVISLVIIIVKVIPKGKPYVPPPDRYAVALHKALLFFDAQKSGRLPKNHKVSWRGNSGLKDGSTLTDVEGGLVGGYYDAGDNIKFHFPMAFSMTLLSWSAIEYSQKFKNLGEYDHVRDLIKWGTDYLLLTFNSSATNIDKIYSQVGIAKNASTTPDDHFCWMRPEDMDYERPVLQTTSGPDLAGEMAAALAAASIVFRDDAAYSTRLIKAGAALFRFARSNRKRHRYSAAHPEIAMFYNSTGYYDEYIWAGTWMFYASGDASYLSLATNPGIPKNADAFISIPDLGVFSWDNKLPGADLLLTRLRIFVDPGYPCEDSLRSYHDANNFNLCSYFPQSKVFNFTPGGMIQLNHGRPQNLQYVVNAAFLASLYADYLDSLPTPWFYCGPDYYTTATLRSFAAAQVDYVLGKNPRNMSYVVGYGPNYPRQVHHRGASIPTTAQDYGCTGGYKWFHASTPDPNVIAGAMVGGPDRFDDYNDLRANHSYTEPAMAGNAGLVAALVSLTATVGSPVDMSTIFFPASPPPHPPLKP